MAKQEGHLGCAHAFAVVIDGESHSHLAWELEDTIGRIRGKRQRHVNDFQAKFDCALGWSVPAEATLCEPDAMQHSAAGERKVL